MKSAITVSLVSEAINGPFLFHGDIVLACREAKRLGFDGIELFAPGPDTVPAKELKTILGDHGLALAAVGTGAGWLQKKLTLTSPDANVRREAIDFIASMIEYAAEFGAPAIVGSMQGRSDGRDRYPLTELLAESLHAVSALTSHAVILYEPLNRYETDLFNHLVPADDWIDMHGLTNVRLLADLFHMNIEEMDIARSIGECAAKIGHVHLADSGRGPAGTGNTDFTPIGEMLNEIGFSGYVSVEALPFPDSTRAAEMTMAAFRRYFKATDRWRECCQRRLHRLRSANPGPAESLSASHTPADYPPAADRYKTRSAHPER